MANLQLAFDIIARDKASSEFMGVADAAEKTGSRISKAFVGLATVGAGVGAAITAGLADNISTAPLNDKLAAQLNLSAQDAGKAGKLASSLFRSNFGEDLPQVNEAVRNVVQNIGTDLNSADFEGITGKVLTLADTFDQDLGGVTIAVGQLLKTGLAPNAQAALDIVARGFQAGADKSGDFLDTLNEYGVQFHKLGIDGATATGIISQGLQAGARDGDLVADALKEFSIRAVDGSTTTSEAFKGLGLDAKTLTDQIAAGGPAAEAGLDTVLDKLRDVKDPARQAQLAVSLFGTQAEDLGKSLYAIDPSTAVTGLGNLKGAAQGVVDTVGSNAQATIEGYRRKLLGVGQDAIQSVGPLAAVAGAVAAFGPAVIGTLAPIASLVAAKSAQTAATAAAAAAGAVETEVTTAGLGARIAATAATVAGTVASVAASAATKVLAAGQVILNAVLSANPIGLVVVALAGLVTGLVFAYRNSETFRDIVSGAFTLIRTVAATELRLVVDAILGFIEVAVDAGAKAFGWVPGIGPKLKDAAADVEAFRDDVNAKLAGIKDKTITVQVQYINKERSLGYTGGGNLNPNVEGKAVGGPINAFQPYLVGEKGPELIVPTRSGVVATAGQTANLLAGSQAPPQVNVYIGGEQLDARVDYRVDAAVGELASALAHG